MGKKIFIGADHAGFELKETIVNFLKVKGFEYKDVGAFSSDRADYPDFAHPVASAVDSSEADLGILICGSGNGINMTANKYKGVRSALCWKEEIAKLAREHNDANVIALPARFISKEEAKACIDIFLSTSFEGGRHMNRVKKISSTS